MTNTTRGWLMALLSMGAFAGAIELVFHPLHPRVPPPHPEPRVYRFGENQTGCAAIAKEYAQAWEQTTSCKEDDECVAETQSSTWSGTDECFRFGNRGVRHDLADAKAREWRAQGCLDPRLAERQVCPTTPVAHCRRGKCVERSGTVPPPEWKRVTIPDVARLYVPPDLELVSSDVKTGVRLPVYKELEGKSRSLTLQVVWRDIAHKPLTAAGVTPPGGKLLIQTSGAIDEFATTLFSVESRQPLPAKPGNAARRFSAVTELADVSGPGAGGPSRLEAPGSKWLVLSMTCETRALCEALPIIAEQSELLLIANAPKKEASSDGGVSDGGPREAGASAPILAPY